MTDTAYSNWMKIDLHIHTDLSKTTKTGDYKGVFTVPVLKSKLLENDVRIFSLTDHNIINIPAYEEYYEDCTEDCPLLLLGVELDIEVESANTTARIYHSLLVFNISDIIGVKRISETLENAYIKKAITDPTKRVLTIGEIVEIFPEEDFFFIPHAGNTKSIVDAHIGQIKYAQKMVLLMQSAFEKVPESKKRIYNDGFNSVMEDSFRGKGDLAYIDFSDNHNIALYPCVHKGEDGVLHEFCYIKGGRNFETLRLAFIDPISRIKTSAEFAAIVGISINNIEALDIPTQKQMAGGIITFSPHLNVIIGGRSSGKSLLMNLLGRKFGAINDAEVLKYNEVSDVSSIKIKTRLDDTFKESSATNPNYVYINQGDIVNYFEGKNLEKLAQKAGKISEYQAAIQKIKGHKVVLNDLMDKLIVAYENTLSDIRYDFVVYDATITKILSEHFLFAFDYDSLYEKYCSTASLIISQNLILDLKAKTDSLLIDENIDLNESDNTVIQDFRALLDQKEKIIASKNRITNKRAGFLSQIQLLIEQKNNEQSNGAKERQASRTAVSEILSKVLTRFSLQKKLKRISDLIESYDYSQTEKFPLNEDIDFAIETSKVGTVRDLLLDGLGGSITSESMFLNLNRLLRNTVKIKNYRTNTSSDLKRKFATVLLPIMETIDKPTDYLDYKNGDTSNNKSPGYNSEKYLNVVLNYPASEIVFIDQPEDNLGNRFIAEDLVDILRSIKFSKQIFLVTHNPSIVVYGDAENIIISENRENSISYTQSVLENKDSQVNICRILDGGEYVFDNRSRKYNIKRILRTGGK